MADSGNTATPSESQGSAAVAVGTDEAVDPAISDAAARRGLAGDPGDHDSASTSRPGASGSATARAARCPIIIGLIVIVIFFQIEEPKFLTAGNLVNLLVQASIVHDVRRPRRCSCCILRRSTCPSATSPGSARFVIAELIAPPVNLPWWLGIIGGLVACGDSATLQGTLVTRLGLPSFIVTLGGYARLSGDHAGARQHRQDGGRRRHLDRPEQPGLQARHDNMSTRARLDRPDRRPRAVRGGRLCSAAARRQCPGAEHPAPRRDRAHPSGPSAVGGVVLVLICNANRGELHRLLGGMPWVVPFVAIVLVFYTWLLARTRLGRYMYAIGANPEAARRAGINVNCIAHDGVHPVRGDGWDRRAHLRVQQRLDGDRHQRRPTRAVRESARR